MKPIEFRSWLEAQLAGVEEVTERFWSGMPPEEKAAWALRYKALVGALCRLESQAEEDAGSQQIVHEPLPAQESTIARYIGSFWRASDPYELQRSVFVMEQIEAGYMPAIRFPAPVPPSCAAVPCNGSSKKPPAEVAPSDDPDADEYPMDG